LIVSRPATFADRASDNEGVANPAAVMPAATAPPVFRKLLRDEFDF
jgi:hypothetical protein